MKIIITGDGKVGHSLAEQLSKDKNDVTIIDTNIDALKKSDEMLDVLIIKGSGASVKTLIEAGVKDADLLIAATNSDETNMVCCLMAKKLGAKKTIARIRDPEHADDLSILKQELGLDMVINPEMSAADEIANLMSFPSAIKVESFSKGRIELIEIKVTDAENIFNKKIKDIPMSKNNGALIGAVVRDNEVNIPNGDFVIKKDDILYIIGDPHSVYRYCYIFGKCEMDTKNAMIVGGGRVAYYLASLLLDMGIRIKIIENDKERCRELSELLPKTLIIYGEGTDENLLKAEGISDMDVFISLTGNDEVNLMSAMLAKQNGVKKVVPKVSRTNYLDVIRMMGIETIINPKLIITNHILKYARGLKNAKGDKIESLYRIIDGKAEILEFIASENISFLNIPIQNLKMKKGIIIAALVRKNKVIIPHGKDSIKLWDRVITLSKKEMISSLNDIVQNGGFQSELQNGMQKLGNFINP